MSTRAPGDGLRFLLSKATPESTIEMNLPAARHNLEVIDALYTALREYLAAADACASPNADDVAAMLRFGKADEAARAAIALAEGRQ